jgi:hypothetical protein
MDLIVIEIFLWAGLIFFLWALKDGLSQLESDIEDHGMLDTRSAARRSVDTLHYDQPDKMLEAIGSYRDAPIYHYAVIAGQHYRFDHIWPSESGIPVRDGHRYVAPGLVYILIDAPPP